MDRAILGRVGVDRRALSSQLVPDSTAASYADVERPPGKDDVPVAEGAIAARQLVYTATFRLDVARPELAVERFLEQVRAWGGHLAVRRDMAVTCRVPAAEFDACVAHVRSLGRVLHEHVEAEDVTRQHRDLGIRLDNARKSRTRLLALLEKADKVQDILQIESELRRLSDEIESMEAELRGLDDRIALATVTVDFSRSCPAICWRRSCFPSGPTSRVRPT